MKKKQTLKYILCDTLAALLSWTALFAFRKLVLDPVPSQLLFDDANYYLGLVVIPAGWLALYTILGTYRNVLRKARLKELLDTLLASLLGSVVIFFILLLDDSSSALDYATDLKFRRALQTDMADTSVIMISQRTTSLMEADRIIVMEDGMPVGIGTHSELLESCEIYREIYRSQMNEKEAAND